MKSVLGSIVVSMVVLALVSGCGPSKRLSITERQDRVISMETETLNRLYSEHPAARDKIKQAAGYGAFSNANVNLIFASAGGGYGVVVDNATGKRTYMRMALGGVGLGLGVKDYRQVLIFKKKEALTRFVESGWEFGGHADAAAKAGETGGEVSGEGDISADIEVYSMTEAGLALQATVAGTKYWKDKDLNGVSPEQTHFLKHGLGPARLAGMISRRTQRQPEGTGLSSSIRQVVVLHPFGLLRAGLVRNAGRR